MRLSYLNTYLTSDEYLFFKSLWGYHTARNPIQFSALLTVRKLFLMFDPHISCCHLSSLFPGLAILGVANRLFPFSSQQPLYNWWLLCLLNCFSHLCLNLQLPHCSLIDPGLWSLTVHIFSSGNSGVVPLFFFLFVFWGPLPQTGWIWFYWYRQRERNLLPSIRPHDTPILTKYL